MGKMAKLEGILKDEAVITIDDLEREYNVPHDSVIIKSLVLYLQNKIDNYDYIEDNTVLLKAFYFIRDILNCGHLLNRGMIKEKLTNIQISIHDRLITKPGQISKKNVNYKRLKYLMRLVETLNIQLEFDIGQDYEGNDFSFISYIIFDLKNISFLKRALAKVPDFANAVGEDNKSIYYHIASKYLNELEESPQNESTFHFLEKVIGIIETSPKHNLRSQEVKDLLTRIYTVLGHVNIDDPYYQKKKNRLGILSQMISKHQKKCTTFEDLLNKYHLSYSFPDYVQYEFDRYKQIITPTNFKDHKTFEEYIISIDGIGAKELDDALSIKKLPNGNYLLGIHISHVTGLIPYNSFLVKEALDRTTAIYFGERDSINSFPNIISKNYGSLNQGYSRLAISGYFEIDHEGSTHMHSLLKSIITVNKNATTIEVNRAIEKGSQNKPFQQSCELLNEAVECLKKSIQLDKRYQKMKGYVPNITYNREEHSPAGNIVQYAMILMNKEIATSFSEHGLPFIYRVHEIDPKRKEVIERLWHELPKNTDNPRYQEVLDNIEAIYPRAKYAMSGSHYGLQLEHYTHMTSPLRRGADLVAAHCLETCYFAKPKDGDIYLLEEEIKRNIDHINERQEALDDFYGEYLTLGKNRSKVLTKKR